MSVLVIIPTYNRMPFLDEAIQSTLSQDYPNVKIVIIDDGSTDGTRSYCEKLTLQSPNVSYLFQGNNGCSSARNAGLKLLTEDIEFICFLDSDDRFLPEKISREAALLQANPAAGFSYSDYILFDDESKTEKLQSVSAAGQPENFALEHFLTNEAKNSCFLYRAQTLRSRRFRADFRYNEDSDFAQRIALEYRGVYCPQPGCWIRWHTGSKSRNFVEIFKAVLQSSQDILRVYPEFAGKYPELIQARIAEVRRLLFRELIRGGNWEEALGHARGFEEKVVSVLHLQNYYQWRSHISRRLKRTEGGR
jgi:glycosyltransferase involved in cell wall biosynthesis